MLVSNLKTINEIAEDDESESEKSESDFEQFANSDSSVIDSG